MVKQLNSIFSGIALTAVVSVSFAAENDAAAPKPMYPAYPTGMYASVTASAFYRDMRSDSGWAYLYGAGKEYHFPSMGLSSALELGYQTKEHWGVAVQGGWVGKQRVKTLSSGSGYSAGDYRKLKTNWTAVLLSMSLKMDYRYYFTAKLGAAYVHHTLHTQSGSTLTRTKQRQVVPTMAVAVQYQISPTWDIGVQYQLMMGSKDWQQDWNGLATRVPVLQQLGLVAAYQFSA